MNSIENSIDAIAPYMTALEWIGIAYVAYTVYKIAKWMKA